MKIVSKIYLTSSILLSSMPCLAFNLVNSTNQQFHKKEVVPAKAVTVNGETIVESSVKPKFYSLVDQNLRPDADEFYVITIYSVNSEARAKIAKSTNVRAGSGFTTAIEYKKGDQLNDDLVIKDIRTGFSRDILVESISSHRQYVLRMSYGDATSRLIPID